MKKEIKLYREGRYYSNGNGRLVLCCDFVKYLNANSAQFKSIKVKYSEKSPRKKGWKKIKLIDFNPLSAFAKNIWIGKILFDGNVIFDEVANILETKNRGDYVFWLKVEPLNNQ